MVHFGTTNVPRDCLYSISFFRFSASFSVVFSSPDIPEAATFGVYVDGDSMEPIYHNKDLIWIEQTACLDDGEIGIFYLDGNAYVKKFQNNRLGTYLVSLNKKYDPIPVTENSSFKIFGRVLS